jgi:hypothetical protein
MEKSNPDLRSDRLLIGKPNWSIGVIGCRFQE